MNLSPWPDAGRRLQWFYRRAVWAQVDPLYNENGAHHEVEEIAKFRLWLGWFPFLTTNNRLFHAYLGWKPIFPSLDPAFYWRDLPAAQVYIQQQRQFVQLSARWGWGRIGDG